jgi:hypothetical protein
MDSSDLLSSRRDRIKANNYNSLKETEYPNKMPHLSSQDLIDIKRGVHEVTLKDGTIVLPACGGPACAEDIYPSSKQGWFVETLASIQDFYPTSIDFDSEGNVYYAGFKQESGTGFILGIFIYKINTDGTVTETYIYDYDNPFDSTPSIAIDRTGTGTDYIFTRDDYDSNLPLIRLELNVSTGIATFLTVYSNIIYGDGPIALKPGTTGNTAVIVYGCGESFWETQPLTSTAATATAITGTGTPSEPLTTPSGYVNTTTDPTEARFNLIDTTSSPTGIRNFSYILFKNSTDFYASDAGNNVIRLIEDDIPPSLPITSVSTYAGLNPPPAPAPAGNVDGNTINNSTTPVRFATPTGITYGPNGNIIVSDSRNNTFRSIDVSNKNVNTIGGYPSMSPFLTALNANQKVDGSIIGQATFSRVTAIASVPSNPNIIYIADNFTQNSNPNDPLPNIRRLIYYP